MSSQNTHKPTPNSQPANTADHPSSRVRLSAENRADGVVTAEILLSEAVLVAIAVRVLELLPQPAPASPYLRIDEAADYLRCSRQRIYDLLSAGRVARYKDGSRVLVLRAELDELVAPALPPSPLHRTRSRVAA
ncbi:MAG: hypothetical protein C5B48_08390 [Candidatus Rokuibacteriota bacterium]|nr:MAG: hypothetical protein C5B48_08390 [Candidatus Rokubacteria bacterium]